LRKRRGREPFRFKSTEIRIGGMVPQRVISFGCWNVEILTGADFGCQKSGAVSANSTV
jgi:hypothetical protein